MPTPNAFPAPEVERLIANVRAAQTRLRLARMVLQEALADHHAAAYRQQDSPTEPRQIAATIR